MITQVACDPPNGRPGILRRMPQKMIHAGLDRIELEYDRLNLLMRRLLTIPRLEARRLHMSRVARENF